MRTKSAICAVILYLAKIRSLLYATPGVGWHEAVVETDWPQASCSRHCRAGLFWSPMIPGCSVAGDRGPPGFLVRGRRCRVGVRSVGHTGLNEWPLLCQGTAPALWGSYY